MKNKSESHTMQHFIQQVNENDSIKKSTTVNANKTNPEKLIVIITSSSSSLHET